MIKQRWLLALITILILAALLVQVDFQAAWQTLSQARLDYLFACFCLSLTFPVLSALRWQVIMNRLGAAITFWNSFRLVMAAWPLGTITPAKSGELVKVLYLRNTLHYAQTTGIILAERLLDVAFLSLSALLGGLWLGQPVIAWMGAGVFAAIAGLNIVSATPLIERAPPKIRETGQRLLQANRALYSHLPTFLAALLFTGLNWLGSYAQTWLLYLALGTVVPFLYTCSALPVAIFVGLLPFTISGMGTRDSAIVFLFEGLATYETNLAVGILYSLYGYWLLTLLGIPFMRAAFAGRIEGVPAESLQQAPQRS